MLKFCGKNITITGITYILVVVLTFRCYTGMYVPNSLVTLWILVCSDTSLYYISYIKFLGIVIHLQLAGSQICVKKYTKKSPMSNDGSRKALFLNRQMKSNFSGIMYIKRIKYYVTSTAAIKTATMYYTKFWQSTFEEMQHIVHHDKANAHQITYPPEVDPSKKCRIPHSHCESIAHCKKMHEISHQTFLLYQIITLHVCISSF